MAATASGLEDAMPVSQQKNHNKGLLFFWLNSVITNNPFINHGLPIFPCHFQNI
jgi:hypothetical protein